MPRRPDARLCSAHARNDRGCRQIWAVKYDSSTAKGVLHNKNDSCWSQEQENTGFNEPASNFAIGHNNV